MGMFRPGLPLLRRAFRAAKVVVAAVTDNSPGVFRPASITQTPSGPVVQTPEILIGQGGLQSGTIRAQIGIITAAVAEIGIAWAAHDYVFVAGGAVTIVLAVRAIYRHAISWMPVNQMADPVPTTN